MNTPAPTGRFIVFEGPEGAGKSTQVARLAAHLQARGDAPLITREPGGTPAGDRIRSVLLDPNLHIDAATEFLLYAAARAQHVSEVIGPALSEGRVVVSDRFTAASVAYQGYGRRLDLDWIHDVNARVSMNLKPDVVLLLDLDPRLGLQRVAQRGAPDRLENADLEFHLRVRDGFLAQAAGDPERWRVIDATASAAEVERAIWQALAPLWGRPG